MIVASAQYDGLSFFPDGYLARRAQRRANRLCGSLLVVALLGVGGAYLIAERSIARLREEHAAVTADFDREAGRLNRLGTMQKEQKTLERRAKLAEALVEKTPRAAVLSELRDLLPEDASLVEMSLMSKVRPQPPKTPEQILAEKKHPASVQLEPKTYDVTLKLGGVAYTDVQVAQYINRLSRSRYFTDVNLIFTRDLQIAGQAVRRFDVEMVVRADPLPATPDNSAQTLAATEATSMR